MGRVDRDATPGVASASWDWRATAMTNGLIDTPPGSPPATSADTATTLAPGTRVDVRDRFVGAWGHGFEVAEQAAEGYRIRRLSDGSVLPDVFASVDLRPERRKQGMWWY